MAKSGTKTKDGKKAKAKLKVPKTIAGVKVPKKVRTAADPVLRAVENPIVAEIAAAALVAAAGALTAKKAASSPKVRATKDRIFEAGDSLKDALTNLANDMADRAITALEGIEEQVKARKSAPQGGTDAKTDI
ncbi:hypothetical protein [Allosphingosinicella vermicomposti]|uniref:hypothetical protein n=1 Tax=Allosphingosinicella vermicomposti TaxID=614671 RepID=UPI000D0F4CF5|nr:hypothetical protein [Allosphingosinicella vermicomposti]